ncbi:MAG: ComEC/Rec2 family competence protein [Thermosipho sp. (in: Bacteria)]|nr:ComEC/Rec2 family competence protein [Thermosipho sp. (in: thermotogales)]
MLVFSFLSSILGALMAPLFSVSKYLLIAPLLFYKKRFLFINLTLFLVINYLGGTNVHGNFEFVGRVVQTNDNYSLIRGKLYYEGKWKTLNLSVGVYKEFPINDVIYYYGNVDTESLNFPRIILDKNRVMSSPYFSVLRRVYLFSEQFRNYLKNYSEVYYGLFGGKIKTKYYYKSGLYHFFSISGAHVSFLFAFSAFFLAMFGLNKKIKNLLSLIFPLIFVIGTGLNLPALRAFNLILGVTVVEIFDYQINKLDILCLIGIIYLIVDPSLAFSLSFYMTFFSTLGILSVKKKYLKPIAAFLGSAPYLSLFSSVNVFSIFGSLILFLPVQLALSLISISFLFYSLNFQNISNVILIFTKPFAWFIEKIAFVFSTIPGVPSGLITYFFFSFLFFIFLLHFGHIPYILKSKSSNTNP